MIVGGVLYRRLNRPMKLLLLLLSISFLTDVYSRILGIRGKSNLHIFHFYTLLEYTLFMIIFSYWQRKNSIRSALRYSIPVFFLIWVISKFTVEDFNSFDSYTTTLEALLLLMTSGFTLYSLIKYSEAEAVNDFRFWVSAAVLLYFAGNVTLFSVSKVISYNLWMTIHATALILSNFMYLKAYLCPQKV